MSSISFTFSGYITSADIKNATDINGNLVDVEDMSDKELVKKLQNGDLFISLGNYLYENHRRAEIKISDFEED